MKDQIVGDPRDVGSVAEYYDVWTERYLKHFGSSIQAHRPTLERDLHDYLLERIGLRDGKRVLDAGCGVCGPAIHFARQRDIRIEGVTISEAQASMAIERVDKAGLSDRIHVRVGDFHELSGLYPAESFDVVYFLESISHSPDPKAVLRGAFEILEPGGILYIKDYFVRPCETHEERSRVLRVVENVDRLFVTRTPEADDILADLRNSGFLPVWVEQPRIEVDNTRWQAFEREHGFDLFDGQDSFDWSQWLEIKFQKP